MKYIHVLCLFSLIVLVKSSVVRRYFEELHICIEATERAVQSRNFNDFQYRSSLAEHANLLVIISDSLHVQVMCILLL